MCRKLRVKVGSKKKTTPLVKFVWALAAIGVTLIGGALLAYVKVFHGGLSADHLAWGSFGGYVGGILGPAFSLFSFIAVVYTLNVQERRIAVEGRRAELERTLGSIEARLSKHAAILAAAKDADTNKVRLTMEANHLSVAEVKACLSFMSYCISELDHLSGASMVSAYYAALYGPLVKRLKDEGVLTQETYHPFMVHV